MQFTLIALAGVFATAISANPTYNNDPPYVACPSGLYSNPQCCATDVLGVADLDCHSRESNPPSLDLEKRTALLILRITQPLPLLSASATSETSVPTVATAPAAALSPL